MKNAWQSRVPRMNNVLCAYAVLELQSGRNICTLRHYIDISMIVPLHRTARIELNDRCEVIR